MNKAKKLSEKERRLRFDQALTLFGMDSPIDDRTTPISYQNYRVVMIEITALVDSKPEFCELESGRLIKLYMPKIFHSLFVLGDVFMAGVFQEGNAWKIAWATGLYY